LRETLRAGFQPRYASLSQRNRQSPKGDTPSTEGGLFNHDSIPALPSIIDEVAGVGPPGHSPQGGAGRGPNDLQEPRLTNKTAKFRERIQFILLLIITATCVIYLMTELRAVLRPLVWAMICVMSVHPVTARVENGLKTCYRRCCQYKHKKNTVLSVPADGEMVAIGKKNSDAPHPPDAPLTSPSDRRPNRTIRHRFTLARFEKGSCVPRCCGVCVSISMILICIGAFAFMILESVLHMREDMRYYELGLNRVAAQVQHVLGNAWLKLPEKFTKDLTENAIATGEVYLSNFVTGVIEHTGRVLIELTMMSLYIIFWLCAPIPTHESTHKLFQRYIYMKSASCLGYGLCVGILLALLKVDLAVVFGLTTFVFNFVPEVGAFIAMLLPLPIIILDSRIESPFFTLAIAIVGQLSLKFLFGNIVEVKIIENDQLMRMHPVVILVAVAFFGSVWGPTGMLVSVPIMAYLKVALLSDAVPPAYRDPVLILMEGDATAPLRHAIREAKVRDSRYSSSRGYEDDSDHEDTYDERTQAI